MGPRARQTSRRRILNRMDPGPALAPNRCRATHPVAVELVGTRKGIGQFKREEGNWIDANATEERCRSTLLARINPHTSIRAAGDSHRKKLFQIGEKPVRIVEAIPTTHPQLGGTARDGHRARMVVTKTRESFLQWNAIKNNLTPAPRQGIVQRRRRKGFYGYTSWFAGESVARVEQHGRTGQ